MGLLEADLTSTRRDLYAANVRTKSLSSVVKDKASKLQALEKQLAGHDEHLKVHYLFACCLCSHLCLCLGLLSLLVVSACSIAMPTSGTSQRLSSSA